MANTKKVTFNRLRALRTGKGLTQKKLADLIDIDQKDYSLLESGTRAISNEMMLKLANALEISPEDLNEPLPIFPNYASNKGTQNHYENYYAEQKDVYERIFTAQKEQIEHQKTQIESLQKQIELQNKFIEGLLK